MELITCKSCGYQNDPHAYFCAKCSKLLLSGYFESGGSSADSELKLSRIVENLKENPHIDILWNDTIDAYEKKIERIQSLLKLRDIGINSEELNQKIDDFLDMCRKPDFEIAFVGAVKAGKSTLINSLLGHNYASTDPNPETAVLTKFRSSEQDYVKIRFYSKMEWDRLWRSVQKGAETFLKLYKGLQGEKYKQEWVGHSDYYIELENSEIENELKKWSSSQSVQHFFVKDIEVGISSLPKDFPKQVVFVDTPGLFDPVAFRSQISIDYINKANSVLVCVKAEDLHGEEVKTVESVFSFSGKKKNKVFIIATNWDKLNNVIIDWNKRFNYLVDAFTGKAFYPTKEMAEKNIMYASAYYFNLCRDYNNLNRNEKNKLNIFLMELQNHIAECRETRINVPQFFNGLLDAEAGFLSPSDLKRLMDVTNIRFINKVIIDEIVNQYTQLLYGEIRNLYDDIKHMVVRIAGERKKMVDDRITISNKDMEKIEEKIKETKKNRDKIQQCQRQLAAALRALNKSTDQSLNIIVSKLV